MSGTNEQEVPAEDSCGSPTALPPTPPMHPVEITVIPETPPQCWPARKIKTPLCKRYQTVKDGWIRCRIPRPTKKHGVSLNSCDRPKVVKKLIFSKEFEKSVKHQLYKRFACPDCEESEVDKMYKRLLKQGTPKEIQNIHFPSFNLERLNGAPN